MSAAKPWKRLLTAAIGSMLAARLVADASKGPSDDVGVLIGAGTYAEAESGTRALLAKALAEHPDVPNTLNNLAGRLMLTGDFAAARQLLERGVAIRRKSFGADDIGLADLLNGLGRAR